MISIGERLNAFILCGFFPMLSRFKATAIAYLKHSLFLLFGFIVAPLAFNHSGESTYDHALFKLIL